MHKYEKILIIGSGGREHAIGWKIKQSGRCGELYFAPGNGGTALLGTNVEIAAKEISKIIDFVKNEKISLTLALPDDPLALGIVDEFNKAGLRIFGPTKASAEVEWSKSFAKNFMAKHNLPTAKFQTFSDFEKAKKYLETQNLPIVIKASGLALGKGVVICQTLEDAEATLYDMMVKKVFGEAGMEVVIEEFLLGPEVSLHAFSDGETHSMFPIAQDHKKIGEGDTGLNTGGMGTIAPVPFLRHDAGVELEKEIIAPALLGLRDDNRDFKGVLFPGLIITRDGPKILEFNARFGDPETETYMRLLETDILDIIDACIDGKLKKLEIMWSNKSACTIILASGGYPLNYEKGKRISGIEDAEGDPNVIVFHSGTELVTNSNLLTSGGRVLGVSAIGDTLEQALISAYQAIAKIHFDGMYYRKDIGKHALELTILN
jgi:phosphoribosylamine--glycine ligase